MSVRPCALIVNTLIVTFQPMKIVNDVFRDTQKSKGGLVFEHANALPLMKRTIALFPLMVAVTILSGCSQEPPGCGDPNTVALLKQIMREQLLPEKWKAVSAATFDKGTRVELPVPSKFEKEIKKFSCEARMSVDASAGLDPETMLAFAMIVGLTDNQTDLKAVTVKDGEKRYNYTIKYTSQNVDDQHIVRIDGVTELQAALTGAFLMQIQVPPPQPVTPVPAPIAAQPPQEPIQTAAHSSEQLAPTDVAESPMPQDIAASELAAADKALNAAYKDTMARLSSDAKISLRDTQRMWMKNRDLGCTSDKSNDALQGASAILAMYACQTDATVKRTTELRAFK